MVWGVVILTMAACHNFAGLVAVRVIMGILEAGVSAICYTPAPKASHDNI